MDPISIAFSLISLLVSFAAMWLSHKTSKQLVEIEKKRDEDAERASKQANVVPSIEYDGRNHRLYLTNRGPGHARNVVVLLDGKPMLEHPTFSKRQAITTTIGPEAAISYLLL